MEYRTARTALIDGDIVAYQTAAWAQARGIDAVEVEERLSCQVAEWTAKAFCSKPLVMLSCSREDNFRRQFFPEYKQHRDGHEDPPLRGACVDFLKATFDHRQKAHLEADDLMGIVGSGGPMPDGSIPVIVTIDKDLRQVPGWHLNPDKDDFPVYVDQFEADCFFHQQWMTGDATDGIPGLYGVGPVKAQKRLGSLVPSEMDRAVLEAYRDHPRGYSPSYALAMARCVRILRAGEWDKAKQTPNLYVPNVTLTWEAQTGPLQTAATSADVSGGGLPMGTQGTTQGKTH